MLELFINLIIWLPAAAAILCLMGTDRRAKDITLWTSIIVFVMTMVITANFNREDSGAQFTTSVSWISALNVNYTVGVDGLNLPLVVLTAGLSILVVLASFSITKSTKVFLALYLFLMTGMFGVFMSLDLFLFYVFFEISLLPMYFLIGVWGGPRKEYAAIKFFLYTLAGSICLLVVMLGLFHITKEATGNYEWNMLKLPTLMIGDSSHRLFDLAGDYGSWAPWFFWLTFIAFAVKVPMAPLHTWLPDAHVEAPTPISMILAGVLLKMGGYALMRITYPIFPEAARMMWYAVATIGVFGIIYGAFCALAQTDWKKLVAYSSVSHMGYVTLGLAVMTRTGFDGAYYQMIAHGITSSMMFFLVGVVYERAHHRDLNRFGGLWLHWPKYSGWAMVGFFAGMGLPGLCGFIGEIMVLLGTFQAADNFDPNSVYMFGALAAFGVVLTAGYILWMFQRVYMGKPRDDYQEYAPVNRREYVIMAVHGVLALVFGVVPTLVFMLTNKTFENMWTGISQSLAVAGG